MLTLTLKNIPEYLHAMLKESAERNRRSLNSEILARLERELAAPTIDPRAHAKELKTFTARLPKVEHARARRYKRQGRA
jgi:predicted HicB family RNase H-like nuclease